ncbi:hypothetical protein BKA70DRAFT_1557055 [Coprinopsis sp. MPI-PUGE-AT-0042]|nr:hypothetical protein BKA70DRAFT_1557055 [Coprinopsis sp. MPI-PUGE-AT-0042]
MSRSAAEDAILNSYGRIFAKSRYANTTLTYVDVGIQLFMCLYGTSVLLGAPRELRKGRFRFIAIGFVILVTSIITAVIDSVDTCATLLNAGPAGADIVRQWTLVETSSLSIVYKIVLNLSVVIGDVLMVWRCYVIWQDRKWVVLPPTIALVAATVTGMILAPPKLTGSASNTLIISSILLSVSVNTMVTILITARLAQTRKVVAQAFPGRKPSPMYTHVVAIMVESAAPLALFGITLAIVAIVTYFGSIPVARLEHWQVVQDVFALLYYSFCSLSPQMIIFRVTTGRSWKDARDSDNGSSIFSRPLEFERRSRELRDSQLSNHRGFHSDIQGPEGVTSGEDKAGSQAIYCTA